MLTEEIVKVVSTEHLVKRTDSCGFNTDSKNNRVVGSLSSPSSERKKLNLDIQVKLASSHKTGSIITLQNVSCDQTFTSKAFRTPKMGKWLRFLWRKAGNINMAFLGKVSYSS